MGVLIGLKDYLADRPETAFLALSLIGLVTLFRMYVKARDTHVATIQAIIPLTEKLCRMLGRIRALHDKWGVDD